MEQKEKWRGLLRSRKFWALVVGLALSVVKAYFPDFPVSEEQLTGVVWLVAAYIMGVAVEDGLHAAGGRSG